MIRIKVSYRELLSFLLFISLTLTPLLYTIKMIGPDTFLDSFENSNYYTLLKLKNAYIIVQSSDHPKFTIEKEDIVVYGENGQLSMSKIYQIGALIGIDSYVIGKEDRALCEGKTLGKIIKKLDKNVLNTISITLWDISVHNLNIKYII